MEYIVKTCKVKTCKVHGEITKDDAYLKKAYRIAKSGIPYAYHSYICKRCYNNRRNKYKREIKPGLKNILRGPWVRATVQDDTV